MEATPEQQRSQYLTSIAVIGLLYFILGFFTWLNGSLIPFLKLACHLETDGQALLVTMAFYMSYLCLALPASFILRLTGFRNGMSLGLLIMAAGALVFIPAALQRSFGLFLSGLFVQGMGLALMQTAVNPYVSVIGPIESAARRMSIMGICNKLAAALGTFALSTIILRGASAVEAQAAAATSPAQRDALLQELAHRIIAPYTALALLLILIAGLIRLSPLPHIEPSGTEENLKSKKPPRKSILEFPHLLLGVAAIFVYVGVEVMAGDVISLYAKALGMPLEQTIYLTAATMTAMLVGYIIGIFTIPKILTQSRALLLSSLLGIIFATAAALAEGWASVAMIIALGLANAPMWPAIFPLAIDGLGKFTRTGSALLIMGIAGGAIIPQLYGTLAPSLGFRLAFFACTVPAYLYIAFYAVRGCRIGRKA